MYYIVIKTSFIGFHRWKDAPQKVKFLQNFHRHKFYVKMRFDVAHNNRAIEFFIIQEQVNNYLRKKYESRSFEYSCETIAEDLVKHFRRQGCCEALVLEDNENGGGYSI